MYPQTEILIQTWSNVPITGPGSGRVEPTEGADPRGAIALARTNWLHSKYQIVRCLSLKFIVKLD